MEEHVPKMKKLQLATSVAILVIGWLLIVLRTPFMTMFIEDSIGIFLLFIGSVALLKSIKLPTYYYTFQRPAKNRDYLTASCPFCGALVHENDLSCAKCGRKIHAASM
jgi:hypothetical protein